MFRFALSVVLMLLPLTCFGQVGSPLTITDSGYYLTTTTNGDPSYVKIQNVIDLRGSDKPGPDKPDKPSEPPVDRELVAKVKAWSLAVSDPKSAQAIAAVYAHIRGALADGTLTIDTVWEPLKQATDSALGVIAGGADWSEFRGKLTAAFTDAQQRGNLATAKQIARILLSVQHGVELSADGTTAITMDQLVEIARRTNLAIDGVTK